MAFFDGALAQAIDERINGAKVERRDIAGGRTVGVRGDGFVISFAMIPVREGDPFRRSLRRRGVVDLMGTVAVSDEGADLMVVAGSAPVRTSEPIIRWSSIPYATKALVIGSVVLLAMPLGVALFVIAVLGLLMGLSWSGADDEPMLNAAEDEHLAEEMHVTAVQLWRVLCDDVSRLVESANIVPALVDAD